MRKTFTLALGAAALAAGGPALADHHQTMDHGDHAKHSPATHALHMAVAAPNRADDKARDMWRHPVETLEFFQVAPDMKVGEYAPGGGWYTKVLGNYLGDSGRLVGLYFNPASGPFDEKTQDGIRSGAAGFPAQAAGWTGKPEANFGGYTLGDIPEGEKGTFDRILLVRMMHNMLRWNIADAEIKAMRDLLKDDGLIGIVQHRAKSDAPWSYANGGKGYLRQDDVVAFMQVNGFELVGASEVNANPADSADHEQGVWEMPPVWRSKRAELKEAGESDRMTLLFRKRP